MSSGANHIYFLTLPVCEVACPLGFTEGLPAVGFPAENPSVLVCGIPPFEDMKPYFPLF
jgi:hypothetical protein